MYKILQRAKGSRLARIDRELAKLYGACGKYKHLSQSQFEEIKERLLRIEARAIRLNRTLWIRRNKIQNLGSDHF